MLIIVLGSNGMLGSMLINYGLKKSLNIIGINRTQFDVYKNNINDLLNFIPLEETNTVIINCIGAIPQKKYKNIDFIVLNSLFSQNLSVFCRTYRIKLLHISTNCVFEGDSSMYFHEKSEHNSKTIYGKTKTTGEPTYGITIRCSIIGPEINTKYGLFEWFMKNEDDTIEGYDDILWNGITTLELSKVIFDIIENLNILLVSNNKQIIHIHSSQTISKYQLLQYMNDIFETHKLIVKKTSNEQHTSLLTSLYYKTRQHIREQLIELKSYILENNYYVA